MLIDSLANDLKGGPLLGEGTGGKEKGCGDLLPADSG